MPTATDVPAFTRELEVFRTHRLMAVLRSRSTEDALWGSRLLVEAGFRIFDITFGTPDAPTVIRTLRDEFPDCLVGAGTVLTVEDARAAQEAGAQFLAAPSLNRALIDYGSEHHILVIPGVATPTEMAQAMGFGARLLKFFPAEPLGGAAFVKAVLGPFPDFPIVATGAIDDESIGDYLKAGALAVGIGGDLLPAKAMAERNAEKILKRARKYLHSLQPEACHGHHG
ncbi:MAG: bifunctional 4-hydroxy-2-oxoglutarate aldolase/2-dehydro-3-deoxy-phosphogluconate aldolase [Candidatus Melainabacteria bacterium]